MSDTLTIRRENLRLLASRLGSIATINEKLGAKRNAPYLYGIVSKTAYRDGEGRRNLGEDKARAIEKACELPPGWMDEDHSGRVDFFESQPVPHGPEVDAVSVQILPLFGGAKVSKTAVYLERHDFALEFPGRNLTDFRGAIVSDDLMVPTLRPGDRLLIDIADRDPAAGIYVLKAGEYLLLRRLRVTVSGALLVTVDSDITNSGVPFDPEEFQIMGRAVYVWSGAKL